MKAKEDAFDLEEFKGVYKKASQKRYKNLSNGYVLDKWLFQIAMFLIFGWLFFVAHHYNYSMDFFRCGPEEGTAEWMQPGPGYTCKNPFYKSDLAWKSQEFLPPGEYGTKLGPLFHSVYYSPFLIFGLMFGLNHLLHNRRRA